MTEPNTHAESRLRRSEGHLRPATRRLSLSILLVTLSVACMCVLSGSAYAATGRPFVSSFGAPAGTSFDEIDAVAIDQSDGHVFVGDALSGEVTVFSSSGTLLTQFGLSGMSPVGIAVDEATGDAYVADAFADAVQVFKPNGSGGYVFLSEWFGEDTPNKGFGEVTGVAVNNSAGAFGGDVYVVDGEDPASGAGAVDVFRPNPAGATEAEEGVLSNVLVPKGTGMEEPNGIAISRESGEALVADSAEGAIYEFGAGGTFEAKLRGAGSPQGTFGGPDEEEGNVTALALDETTGDIMVAEAERRVVSELNPAGEWIGWETSTPAGPLIEPRGIAVGATGQVYVADAGRQLVDVFGNAAVVPGAFTDKATKVGRTSATLTGMIDGEGKPAKYHFDWGPTEELGQSTPTVASAAGEEKVAATITALRPSTTYFFRIVGENENGSNAGAVRQFTTPTAVEDLSTGEATTVAPTSLTMTGSLNPGGLDTHYFFEWGPTMSYGTSMPQPPADAGSGIGLVVLEEPLSGLMPNTVYHYRLVAENELGVTRGEDRSIKTSGPPRINAEAASGLGHNEATLNAKINPGKLPTAYHFEYGETTSYGTEVPSGGGSLPAGESPDPVSVSLTGLKIGTTYHYRVVATNGASTEPSLGEDHTFTTVPSAPIDATFATEVGTTTATLHTQINPLGNDTHFYFQYGPESCKRQPSRCLDVPTEPGADVGAGSDDQAENQAITGLRPGTKYFYRVIAENVLGTTEGEEHTITTVAEGSEASRFALPDGRAWEMVTPPQKDAPVEALTREGGVIEASEDGDKLTYVTEGSVGEGAQGNRSPEVQQIIATRGAEAWTSDDVATPSTEAKGVTAGEIPEYQYFSSDLSVALVEPAGKQPAPPLAPGVTEDTMYLRDNKNGTYTPLVTPADVAAGTKFGVDVHFEGASPSLGDVVIGSKVPLLGEDSTQGLYEWAEGKLQQVSILPTGQPATGLVQLGYNHVTASAISEGGTRIVWTNSLSEGIGPLYIRDTARRETVRLDVPQGTGEPPSFGEARFQAASSDGTKVFFTDWQRLTLNSTAERAAKEPDLYECEMSVQNNQLACILSDLTAPANNEEHANVKGDLLAVNAQGSEIMLVAQDILAKNANGNGEIAQPGKNNLYELHDEAGVWQRTFVGRLSSEDSVEWENNNNADTAYLTARLSPNGRYFAFMSAASLTGYDNVDVASDQPAEEVYLYDTSNQSLSCVSCNPTGALPHGVFDTLLSGEGLGLVVDRRRVWSGEAIGEHWLAGNVPGWTAESVNSAMIQPRYLTDQGRLFFNSPDDLVPQATNGKDDVYEYEPTGVGTCESSTGGCIALLSSGSSEKESAFLEATPSGNNVFFITAQQLLPQDTDTAFDIYDARECSAESPCQQPPQQSETACGDEAACRPAMPAVQPTITPGGSATTTASPNASLQPAHTPVHGGVGVKAKSRPLTAARKLANALRACRKDHDKGKRTACEVRARRLYAAHLRRRAKARPKMTRAGRAAR